MKSEVPLLLKVSPDIQSDHVSEIANIAIKNNISGLIVTNTTNGNRENLISRFKNEKGGLSGEPLATAVYQYD